MAVYPLCPANSTYPMCPAYYLSEQGLVPLTALTYQDKDGAIGNEFWRGEIFAFGERVIRPFFDRVVYPAANMVGRSTVQPITNIFYKIFWPQSLMPAELITHHNALAEKKVQKEFNRLQDDGFPFTQMSPELVREALTIPIGDHKIDRTIDAVNEMLKARLRRGQLLPGTAVWKEMENIIKSLNSRVLGEMLDYLRRKDGDSLDASCFHILLKMGINENYALPEIPESKTQALDAGVKACLSGINFSTYPNPSRLIDVFELILYKNSIHWVHSVLPHANLLEFHAFVVDCLTHISFEKWERKGCVITELFETIPEEEKISLASVLESASCDATTREVGISYKQALLRPDLQTFYHHVERLQELLPCMDEYLLFWHSHINLVFYCDYPSLRDVKAYASQYSFRSGHILKHDHLIFGIHEIFKEPSLVAFDKASKRLIWGIPVQDRFIYSKMTSLGLVLVYQGDPIMHILHPETGEEKFAISLPAVPDYRMGISYECDRIHITPSGFCYFEKQDRKQYVVYGGQISTGEWKQSFKVSKLTCPGDFTPLGPYLLLRHYSANTQAILSPDGSIQTLPNCSDLLVKNGKAFAVEVESTKGAFTLTMQDVATESESFQLRGPKFEVSLGSFKDFTLLDVGDDGTVVGVADFEVPIFVDIVKKEVITGQHRVFHYTKFFDPKKSELWLLDANHTVWRQTKDGSQLVGIAKNFWYGDLFPEPDEMTRREKYC